MENMYYNLGNFKRFDFVDFYVTQKFIFRTLFSGITTFKTHSVEAK